MHRLPIIAVVDDDPGIRGSLDSLFRSAGMRSAAFDSAEALLASGLRAELACIVTDLHMPGTTGLELQAEMTRRGWPQPLIVMTAYPTEGARLQAMGCGAVAFLAKPIDPDTLLDAIQAALTAVPR